jgi:hypothetical protein
LYCCTQSLVLVNPTENEVLFICVTSPLVFSVTGHDSFPLFFEPQPPLYDFPSAPGSHLRARPYPNWIFYHTRRVKLFLATTYLCCLLSLVPHVVIVELTQQEALSPPLLVFPYPVNFLPFLPTRHSLSLLQ